MLPYDLGYQRCYASEGEVARSRAMVIRYRTVYEGMLMEEPIFSQFGDARLVLFGGADGRNGCLSIWYPAAFDLHDHRFANVAQYLVYAKAMAFGDEATAMRVFAMDDASYLKGLSGQVTPFDEERWDGVRANVLREGLKAKFDQNEELARFLRETDDALIGACLTGDAAQADAELWGTGVGLDDPNAATPLAWTGKNLLGRLLAEVRSELPEELVAEKGAQDPDGPEAAGGEGAESGPAEEGDGQEKSLRDLKLAAIKGGEAGTQALLDGLADAMVVVPVEVIGAPEEYRKAIADLKPGEGLDLRDGTEIQPCLLRDGNDARWLAAFSEVGEIKSDALKGFSFLRLPMGTVAGMALEGGGELAGVVLDAFTQALQIPAEVLRDLSEKKR